MPFFDASVKRVKRIVRKLQQVGLPVSLSLVSVALKSCHFRTCSKFRMWVKNFDTSCYQSELTLHPRPYTCLDFPVPIKSGLADLLPRAGVF